LAWARQDWREHVRVTEIQDRIKRLTPREAEVFALVVTGMLNRQIAAELVIAEKTVGPRSNSAPACHGPDCP
jgi:FixJ family two-component response regulator